MMRIYHPTEGSRDIPAIDYTPLKRSLGWRTEPPGDNIAPENPAPKLLEAPPREPELFDATRSDALDIPPNDVFDDDPRALTIINEGNSVDELAILPTIGKGSAKVILAERPDNGYESLSELPAKIFAPPYNCDLSEIKAYEG